MPFVPNPRAAQEIADADAMGDFLGEVAADAVAEVRDRLPYPDILGGVTVSSEVVERDGVKAGLVKVKGPGWHLWEYGTTNHGARPAIRPGVQAALAKRGGRLGAED